MSLLNVKDSFKKHGIEKDILEFTTSSATVALAASVLGVKPGMIAKTLSFKENDTCILIVVSGDKRIDNAKFKNEFGYKARMLNADEVLMFTGHQVGGVCPFGLINDLKVYLDNSLKEYLYVYPACGSSNSAIKLTIDELYNYSKAIKWVDVVKYD